MTIYNIRTFIITRYIKSISDLGEKTVNKYIVLISKKHSNNKGNRLPDLLLNIIIERAKVKLMIAKKLRSKI